MKGIVGIIIFFGFLSLLSCSTPEAPQYLGLRDFSIRSINLDSSLLFAQVSFYNPNAYNLELKRGDVNVYLNDQLANHYVMDSTIFVPKKDTFYVPLNLKVSPKLLINSALSMLLNNNKIKVRLEGNVHIKRSGVTFKVPFNYEVMESLQ